MMYHPTVKKILTLLKSNNYWYETFEHEPVRTSEEAAKIRHGYTLSQGAKAMIIKAKFRIKEPGFVMIVLPGDERLASSKVKRFLNAKEIRFATVEEVSYLTEGIESGGVPPFGNVFNLPVYVDKKLLSNEKIIFNAGDRRFSIAMLARDYLTVVEPIQVDSLE